MRKFYTLLVAMLCCCMAANAAMYVNVKGEFNGWKDNGVQPNAEGIAKHENLKIGTTQFKVMVWDGKDDVWYSTGGALPQNQWVKMVGDAPNMTIAGAKEDELFNVEFNVNTNEIKVSPVIQIDYTEWTFAVAGEFNEWNTTANKVSLDADGNGEIKNLALGADGFKILINGVWNSTTNATLKPDEWTALADGANVIVPGASADAVFDMQYDAKQDAVKLTLVSGTVGNDDTPTYNGWFLNVLYDNNDNQDNGVAFTREGEATVENCFIGCNGFSLKIWDGSKSIDISTGVSVEAGKWLENIEGANEAKMTVAGANPGDVYSVTYSYPSKELRLEKTSTKESAGVIIRGSILEAYTDGNWVEQVMTAEGGAYTYKGKIKPGSFGIAEMYDFGSKTVQGAWYAAAEEDDAALNQPGTFAVKIGGHNFNSSLDGTYSLKFDPVAKTLSIMDDNTGVDEVGADTSVAVYYNLQGVPVDNPTSGHLYIKKQGATVSKVLVK